MLLLDVIIDVIIVVKYVLSWLVFTHNLAQPKVIREERNLIEQFALIKLDCGHVWEIVWLMIDVEGSSPLREAPSLGRWVCI